MALLGLLRTNDHKTIGLYCPDRLEHCLRPRLILI